MRGYIFRCNDKTKDEVFSRLLLGDEAMYLPAVKKINAEDKLFLYDLSTFEFSGPYEPIGEGGNRLEPTAWKSKFPAQIRFRLLPETKTIQFNKIERIIKLYHKGMFPDMELDEGQVKAILQVLTQEAQ